MAAGALVYGLYVLLLPPSKTASTVIPGDQVAEIEKLVADVTDGLNKEKLSEVEGYIIRRAQAPWARDPFYQRPFTETEKVQEMEEEVPFIYSGYLELGSSRVAIINGRDYQVGEALEESGYKLERILPERVVIVKENLNKKIIIPHQENVVAEQ